MRYIHFNLTYLYILCSLPTLAQGPPSVIITGAVVNEKQVPLTGSSLQFASSRTSAITDNNGIFKISLVTGTDTLYISHLGYETKFVIVSRNTALPLYIALTAAHATQLQEVVVNTGYQSLPKERATGSFEKIDQQLINRSVSTDIINRLEGVTSIYFDRRTGGRNLSIRGRSTIMGNASPLIILDNFPYDGDINNINPNDIDNITLLKDAAAASIWGVRAANGVVVITTKKGRYNKPPVWEFTANITGGLPPNLYYAPAMTSTDFIDVETFLYNKGYYTSTINNTTKMPIISPVVEILARRDAGLLSPKEATEQIDVLRRADVRKDFEKYFYRHSLNQQYALSYSGGSNMYSYLLSAGWDKNSTYLERNGLHRLTFRSENAINPLKGLYLQAGITYAQTASSDNNPGMQGIYPTSKVLYPYAALAGAAGGALPIVKDYRLGYLDTVGAGRLLDWKYRPLDELRLADNTTRQTDTRLNVGLQYKFTGDLNADLKYQYELQSGNTRNLYSQDSYTARNLVNQFSVPNGSLIKYGVPKGGIIDQTNATLVAQVGRGQLNYHHSWNTLHELTVITGAEIRQTRTRSNKYRVYGYNDNTLTYGNVNFTDMLPTYNSLKGTLQVPNPADFSDNVLHFTSLFGNAAYTLHDRYTLSASARKDASNLFGVQSNQKGVPLWSAGFCWQISKEGFYKLDALPLLKLRLTYGYNGNVDNTLSALTTLSYYSNAYLTGLQYAIVRNPGNPELKWERSAMLNIGVDFSTYENRLSGSIDYYRKKGTDLIGEAPVDPTTGVVYPSTGGFAYKGNVAGMKGSGLDLELHGNILTGNLQWQADVLFNYTTNTVTRYKLPSATANSYVGYGNLTAPFEGKPVYAIYSYRWAGLDPATGDPQGYLDGQISKNYAAITSAGAQTLVYHGSAVPVFFGSLRNTLTYRNISVSANIMYKGGYYFRRSSINYNNLFANWINHADYSKRWQKAGDEQHTSVPSLVYPNISNRDAFYNNATVLVEKGDHIRLQDINITYSFGTERSLKKYFKQLQCYMYINNIGILWKANKSGLDPDYYSGGFPLPMTISLGCKATF